MSHKLLVTALLGITLAGTGLYASESKEEHHHDAAAADEGVTVTGEIVDMACYIDHGAQGAGHRDCAAKCISSGLPVGIKSSEGTYLLIGDHKPINSTLADLAAQTVTVHGKLVERDGFKMIENAEILN